MLVNLFKGKKLKNSPVKKNDFNKVVEFTERMLMDSSLSCDFKFISNPHPYYFDIDYSSIKSNISLNLDSIDDIHSSVNRMLALMQLCKMFIDQYPANELIEKSNIGLFTEEISFILWRLDKYYAKNKFTLNQYLRARFDIPTSIWVDKRLEYYRTIMKNDPKLVENFRLKEFTLGDKDFNPYEQV